MAASHLEPYLNPESSDWIKKSAEQIRHYSDLFDAIACRGISGILIASQLSVLLNKPIIVVRKGGEKRHSGNVIETTLFEETPIKYIVVDDFVCSGDTLGTIQKRISEHTKFKYVGMFQVTYNEWYEQPGDME